MNDPRNVTPDEELGRISTEETQPRRGSGEWSGWSVERRGRDIPWVGILVVLVGIVLLIKYFYPAIGVGTLLLLGIGLAFLAGWALGRASFFFVPGAIFMALGITELIEDLALFGPAGTDVDGLASSALAIAFLLIWLVSRLGGRRSTWPLWGAGIFGVIGVLQLSGRLINLPIAGLVWPIAIIVVGLILIFGVRRR